VALGAIFAFEGTNPSLTLAHQRVNLFGLLGVSIVGVVYQFYPPAVGQWPGATDRTAIASLVAIAGGVFISAAGAVVAPDVSLGGTVLALVGSVTFCYLLVATIRFQTTRHNR
jgi:hypothetical protein